MPTRIKINSLTSLPNVVSLLNCLKTCKSGLSGNTNLIISMSLDKIRSTFPQRGKEAQPWVLCKAGCCACVAACLSLVSGLAKIPLTMSQVMSPDRFLVWSQCATWVMKDAPQCLPCGNECSALSRDADPDWRKHCGQIQFHPGNHKQDLATGFLCLRKG